MNEPRILYERKDIEIEPLDREIMVHLAMHYKCEVCGTVFRFWLEKGLEDKKQDEINPNNHKPVPFCIGCLCGGTAKHFAWESDISLYDYRQLNDDENYFENTQDENCGIPHFRNNGNAKIVSHKFPELKDLESIFAERKQDRLDDFTKDDEEDDPYGLANISTTTLKAELRRRKRWK